MRLTSLALLTALALAGPASAPPPPPPAPAEQAQIDAFFAALPRRLPVSDFSAFEKVVSPDVTVWRDGVLVHRNRTSWFAEMARNPFVGWQSPKPPVAAGVGRDDFYRTQDGAIVVRELTTAIPPDGEFILYHLGHNLRFVTYVLSGGRLVRVDYDRGLDRMNPPASYRKP